MLPLCGFYFYFSKCSPIFEQTPFQNALQNFICTIVLYILPSFLPLFKLHFSITSLQIGSFLLLNIITEKFPRGDWISGDELHPQNTLKLIKKHHKFLFCKVHHRTICSLTPIPFEGTLKFGLEVPGSCHHSFTIS